MATSPKRVFFSAGEASGDAYAAAILARLRPLMDVQAEGIGAVKLREAGGNLIADSSSWGSIGITESILVAPKVWLGMKRAQRALRNGPKGLFIAIDFGYLNVRLCRYAKAQGWKVLYFVPPGSWRRGPQGRDLPKITDAVVTPTSWSEKALRENGTNVFWYGHPLKELRLAAPEERTPAIACLLGSRGPEVSLLLPVVAEVARQLPDRVFEFALAPNVDAFMVVSRWRLLTGRTQDRFVREPANQVLARCEAGIVCSGTATLEAALARCPHIIVYKVRRMVQFEAWLLRVRPKLVGLPNLVLDEMIVPELIQARATPENILAALTPLLQDSPERARQLEAFETIDRELGPADAITRTAGLAVSMLGAE